MEDVVRRSFAESIRAQETFLAEHAETLVRVARLVADAIQQGHKVLLFGNGSSAADAQQIAATLVSRFSVERRPLAAVALCSEGATLTAIALDHGFDTVFARQIEALGTAGDVAIALSTGDCPRNVLQAIEACGKVGLFIVGMAGGDGGAMEDQVDFLLNVSATEDPARVRECHVLAAHVLCDLIERQV